MSGFGQWWRKAIQPFRTVGRVLRRPERLLDPDLIEADPAPPAAPAPTRERNGDA